MKSSLSFQRLASRLVLSLLLPGLAGCGSQGVTTDYLYAELARSVHLDLVPDGYLIGIEKRPRAQVHAPAVEPLKGTSRYRRLPEGSGADRQPARKRNHELNHVLNDGEVCLVTHVAAFFDGRREFLYNAYVDAQHPERELADQEKLDVEDGYRALDDFERSLNQKLEGAEKQGRPYTHLLVLSMGWHNAQRESIRRYNLIVTNLQKIALRDGRAFKPLVIGFTWPSAWYGLADSKAREKVGHIGSYFNKANDADEIGYTLANQVVNRIARGAKAKAADRGQSLRLVVIGHSFGVRLVSRALFSEAHLAQASAVASLPPVDLFLGLQGAVSILRFSKGAGGEGSPYAEFAARKTAIVLTASDLDEANPAARIFTRARNAGSRYGLEWAWQHGDTFHVFRTRGGSPEDWQQAVAAVPQHVLVIDATDVIHSHNDILGESQARLIWRFLDAFAPSP